MIRYARVQSTILDENNDEYVNQLQTIDSEDEEEEDGEDLTVKTYRGNERTLITPSQRAGLLRTVFLTGLLILCYFILSIGLTFYQRWLLKGYNYPFTVVLYHLFVKLVMSTLIRICYRAFTGKQRIRLPVGTVMKKVGPTAFFGAIDIGFSQWGLEFVDVALYTMTKSTVIIFISFFAIVLKLEKKSWSLLIIVLMISSGLFFFTYRSTEFHLQGFCLLLGASAASGARWTTAQLLMQKSKLGLHNPIDMIYFMQPYMMISLLPFACIFESTRLLSHFNQLLELESYEIFYLWIKISVGAFLAFFMEISEFLVLSQTSSLTLSLAGILKEIFQLVLAVEINSEVLSLYNIVGLMLCLGGIVFHVCLKYWSFKSFDLHEKEESEPEKHFDANDQYLSNLNKTVKTDREELGEGKISPGTNVVIAYKVGNQSTPLLNYTSESEDDAAETDSKVLFDILKRRDETREFAQSAAENVNPV